MDTRTRRIFFLRAEGFSWDEIAEQLAVSSNAATVTLEDLNSGRIQKATTLAGGECEFSGLAPSRYILTVKASGFREARTGFPLNIGQKARPVIHLEIESLAAGLDVIAAKTSLDPNHSSISTTIDQRSLESLPTQERGYLQFSLLDSSSTRDNQPVLIAIPTSGLNVNG